MRLDHPLILKYIDHFVENKQFYMVTEYCQGGSFDKLIQKKVDEGVRFTEKEYL